MPQQYTPTEAELQLLRAIAELGTIKAAAERLGVSPHTVDSQLDQLRRKTGLRYLPQLVAWGVGHGCLPVAPPPRPKPTLVVDS